MTSPTTSADAVKVLQEISSELTAMATKKDPLVRLRRAERFIEKLQATIGLLTKHAEAGAVAWEMKYDGKVPAGVLIACCPEFVRSKDRAKQLCEGLFDDYGAECSYRPVFAHPAQPASQQGEEWRERIGAADHVAVITETKYGPGIWFNTQDAMRKFSEWPFRSNTHPTGDKVRGLVDSAMAAANKLRDFGNIFSQTNFTDRHGDGPKCHRLADRLEKSIAALDQEKNDGR